MHLSSLRNEPRLRSAMFALGLVAAGVATAVLVGRLRQAPAAFDCEQATREALQPVIIVVCNGEYARTGDPFTGARLASQLRLSEMPDEAKSLATRLLDSPARSDALRVLGRVALTQGDRATAHHHLELARALHIIEQRPGEVAIDAQMLYRLASSENRFADGLRVLDECIGEAHRAGDTQLEGYCHMSAAFLLGDVGHLAGANAALDHAQALLDQPRDLASLEVTRGSLHQQAVLAPPHVSHAAQAIGAFERAATYASLAGMTRVRRQAELNLAYELAEVGRTPEARLHLELARALDPRNEDHATREMLSARIAYREGDLAGAAALLARVLPTIDETHDVKLRITALLARIALERGEPDVAIAWAQRGVAIAEALRSTAALELRSWLLSVCREPYELLFTALASVGRVEEALLTFDSWQGRLLLDQIARDKLSNHAVDLRDIELSSASLRALMPRLSSAPIGRLGDRDAMRAALRDVELIAIVVANDELWRISANHGQLAIFDLGPLAVLRPALDAFQVKPTSADLARLLGARLLGADALRATDETLFVLLDGAVAGVPLAALRAEGGPLIAMRPLVRPPRLSELACVPSAARLGRAVVIADARGDLPAARTQAQVTAARFRTRAAVGPAATSRAVLAATQDDLLDVAVHANVTLGVGSLELFFGERLSVTELSARRHGPPLVVLSACASAASDDGELGMALSTAFLASGSSQVMATLRPVSDAGASEVTAAFYRDGGLADPPRILARVQATLSHTSNQDWPNFALFGHDTCRKEPR